ncbi:MAG: hypothetical protein HYV63_15425 [Candidatus Schekmanbacteria bacterium]|nr:hypothetical protein [Candidatus Schekmanbacteria bacterium]
MITTIRSLSIALITVSLLLGLPAAGRADHDGKATASRREAAESVSPPEVAARSAQKLAESATKLSRELRGNARSRDAAKEAERVVEKAQHVRRMIERGDPSNVVNAAYDELDRQYRTLRHSITLLPPLVLPVPGRAALEALETLHDALQRDLTVRITTDPLVVVEGPREVYFDDDAYDDGDRYQEHDLAAAVHGLSSAAERFHELIHDRTGYRHLGNDAHKFANAAEHLHGVIEDGAQYGHIRRDFRSVQRGFHHLEQALDRAHRVHHSSYVNRAWRRVVARYRNVEDLISGGHHGDHGDDDDGWRRPRTEISRERP